MKRTRQDNRCHMRQIEMDYFPSHLSIVLELPRLFEYKMH